MRVGLLAALFALSVAPLSCAKPTDESATPSGTIVVGVMSDLETGVDVARLGVVMTVDGTAVRDEMLDVGGATEAARFPLELAFADQPDGSNVEVALRAFQSRLDDEEPFLTRLASSRIVAGRRALLRVRLERECIPSYRIEGGTNTPTCAPPETCVATACVDPYVRPDALEDYSPDWATSFADACKPLDPTEPFVAIGQGRSELVDIAEGDVVKLSRGTQGGFHFWLGVRMKNLHQAGSTTTLRAAAPELGWTFMPKMSAYGYDVAEGGVCELVGLRYELFHDDPSLGQVDAAELLGAKVDIEALLADVSGDLGTASVHATVSEDATMEHE